jgi:hypothetical protein
MTKIEGSGSHPHPHQNVMDLEQCLADYYLVDTQ